MGCDIHLHAEKRNPKRIDTDTNGSLIPDLIIPPKPKEPISYGFGGFDEDDYVDPGLWTYVAIPDSAEEFFKNRNYALFSFLAGVRNYSMVKPISEPRGLPDDVSWSIRNSFYHMDYHSISWLLISELIAFDYSQMVEDRRNHGDWRNGDTVPAGQGIVQTYGDFIGGKHYFKVVKELASVCDRIVFGFDS